MNTVLYVVSEAGKALALVLLAPVVILLIGAPIVLLVRLILALVT